MILLLLLLVLSGCSSSEESAEERMRRLNQKGEYIYRLHDEFLFNPPVAESKKPAPYPWEVGNQGKFPRITKEFFRCKGSSLNPPRAVQKEGTEVTKCLDCGGTQRHSLPVRDGKEFIYPVLTDILNYIQAKTGKRVVITSGHRCPEHNTYVDSSKENQTSKHMIGAEVAFYVQGLENSPDFVVKQILEYYHGASKYQGMKDFQEFQRYEKSDTDVSIQPWYNKEVFIKIFGKKEGRNFDNRHPYPYISLQVRYDWDHKEKVLYSWEKAFNSYMRH